MRNKGIPTHRHHHCRAGVVRKNKGGMYRCWIFYHPLLIGHTSNSYLK